MVDDHHAGDLAGIERGVLAGDESADGEADEDERAFDLGAANYVVDFGYAILAGCGRPRVAPRGTGDVVGTHFGELGDFGLDQVPVEGEAAGDEYGGASCAGAVEMDAIASGVNEGSQGRRGREGLRREETGEEYRGQKDKGAARRVESHAKYTRW